MIIAIDPGQNGAIAAYDTRSGELNVFDMPTRSFGNKGRLVVDVLEIHGLLASFKDLGASVLFIEQVGGLPGQSASGAFTFGEGFGAVTAVATLLGYRIERIPPATWKTALRVPSDKKSAITRASEMIPTHHKLWSAGAKGTIQQKSGRAEAAMLALYGERILERLK